MATKPDEVKAQDGAKVEEVVPSESALALDALIQNGFILVQWIGHRFIMKLAPSPKGAIRKFGAANYGLVRPKAYMMILKDDFDPRFYRRLTAEEKPDKNEVTLSVSGRYSHIIRVTW